MAIREYINIFSDLAVALEIIPRKMLENMENVMNQKLKKDVDLARMNISALYLLQHLDDGCQARCAFCAQCDKDENQQRRTKLVDNTLIRVPLELLTKHLRDGSLEKKGIERICIQTIYNENTAENLISLVKYFRSACLIPLTACSIPLERQKLQELEDNGLDIITINFETATKELFHEIRGEGCDGPYRWEIVEQSINDAVEIFGKNKVGSHLQLGFGETAQEALSHIQWLSDKTVFISLFAFRPLPGTLLSDRERISYQDFHKIQLGSYIIQQKFKRFEDFQFNNQGEILSYGMAESDLHDLIESGMPFRNKGCPGCNRIYYETNSGERFYTYPREPLPEEISLIKKEIFRL